MRLINDIIIHCSATIEGQDVRAKDIKSYHVNQRGWRDIGYHYVVDLDGSVERGRPVSQPGAHCLGHNAHSIGICYIGGLDKIGKPKDTRTAAQRQSLLKLITKLTSIYRCATHGHRDYAAKDCPCFDATKEYANIVKQIRENIR